jgi:uncharacterized damage-inducible protein DinB
MLRITFAYPVPEAADQYGRMITWTYSRNVGQVRRGIAVVPLAVLSSKSTYPTMYFSSSEAATVRTSMTKTQAWFERKFEFTFPVQQFPNLCVRLRGTPARLEEMVQGVSPELLVAKPEGKWSAQEHAGHLADLEPLWMARVGDFLGDRDTLTIADLTNRKTDDANHNARGLVAILAEFRAARFDLLDRVDKFHHLRPSLLAQTKLHPRLQQPMRLVDHLYFVAEHDDHHLARIWELTRTLTEAPEEESANSQ